jgi:hypothetical protein
MNNKFKFHQVVWVNKEVSDKESPGKIINKIGVIRGMSESEGIWHYAVMIDDECWTVPESSLVSFVGRYNKSG